jgi:RNA polymerase sigma-70 factor (ECF subfamily)
VPGGSYGDNATCGPDFDCLLAAAQSGAEWALTGLFSLLNPPLLRYLRARELAAAEDLAGDVWLAVAAKLSDFRGGETAFRAWIFTVAHRRLVDYRRRAVRRRTEPVPNDRLVGHPAGDDPCELVVDRVSAQEAIDQLVARLSPLQAEVVLLRVVADLDAAQVAAAMGRSTSWVRVTQHRALRRLAPLSGRLVTR